MPHTTTLPAPESPAARLPPGVYYQLVHTFTEALPPPLSASAEHLALRNEAAISHVAALHPANIAEAELAALHVIALQQVKSATALAEDPTTPLPQVVKCRAQALSLMRQAHGALRALDRLQVRREKNDANPETRDHAANIKYNALSQMQQALNAPPPRRRRGRSWHDPAPAHHNALDLDTPLHRNAAERIRLIEELDHLPDELVQEAIAAGHAVLDHHSKACGRGLGEGAAPTENCSPGDPPEDPACHQAVPRRENEQP